MSEIHLLSFKFMDGSIEGSTWAATCRLTSTNIFEYSIKYGPKEIIEIEWLKSDESLKWRSKSLFIVTNEVALYPDRRSLLVSKECFNHICFWLRTHIDTTKNTHTKIIERRNRRKIKEN